MKSFHFLYTDKGINLNSNLKITSTYNKQGIKIQPNRSWTDNGLRQLKNNTFINIMSYCIGQTMKSKKLS